MSEGHLIRIHLQTLQFTAIKTVIKCCRIIDTAAANFPKNPKSTHTLPFHRIKTKKMKNSMGIISISRTQNFQNSQITQLNTKHVQSYRIHQQQTISNRLQPQSKSVFDSTHRKVSLRTISQAEDNNNKSVSTHKSRIAASRSTKKKKNLKPWTHTQARTTASWFELKWNRTESKRKGRNRIGRGKSFSPFVFFFS
jgi:hypothetical protein